MSDQIGDGRQKIGLGNSLSETAIGVYLDCALRHLETIKDVREFPVEGWKIYVAYQNIFDAIHDLKEVQNRLKKVIPLEARKPETDSE